MTEISDEVAFAKFILAMEPPKIEGGSKARQDWLGLMGKILIYLAQNNLNIKTYTNIINGYPPDWNDENY